MPPGILGATPPGTFVTKDSGQRQSFDTGMVRDVSTDKLDWTILPWIVLKRDVELYMRGAKKYARDNWKKGQPFTRAFESMMRHMYDYLMGDRSEDHLAAIRFNAACLIYYEEMIKQGELPAQLDDMTQEKDDELRTGR